MKRRSSNTSGSNPLFKSTDLVAIFGRRGSGKSTLCKTIQRAYPRIIVFDLLHEYDAADFEYFAENFAQFGKIAEKIAEEKPKKYRVLIRFDIEDDTDQEETEKFLRVIYYLGNCLVVLEEVHHYMRREYLPRWFKNLVLTGRHRNIGIMSTSQRPAEVSKTFIAQCQHVFTGVFFEKNDIKYLSETVHVNSEVLESIKPFTFLHYQPGFPVRVVKNR